MDAMVISIFLLSSCDVYNTLYINQAEDSGITKVSDDEILIEGGETYASFEDDVSVEVPEDTTEVVVEDEQDEEVEQSVTSGDAIVTIIEETELISLVPKAEDPDADVLTFTFTSPLDGNGEWQTTYGDAGEYTVTVTVSDGELTASKEILIIINKKEEAPIFESLSPDEISISIDETNSISFEISASDLNNDVLSYTWKLDGVEIGNEQSVDYQTTYEDSGSHTIKVTVSDGVFDTENIWAVTVNNLNRKPFLVEVDDITASESDIVAIELEAVDDDGDELTYNVDDARFVQDDNIFTWETTYDDAGEHTVTVTVSDGVDETSQELTVSIENVNRAPVIIDIIQK